MKNIDLSLNNYHNQYVLFRYVTITWSCILFDTRLCRVEFNFWEVCHTWKRATRYRLGQAIRPYRVLVSMNRFHINCVLCYNQKPAMSYQVYGSAMRRSVLQPPAAHLLKKWRLPITKRLYKQHTKLLMRKFLCECFNYTRKYYFCQEKLYFFTKIDKFFL